MGAARPGRPGAPGRVGRGGLARPEGELELRAGRHVALPAERAEAAGARRVLDRGDVLAGGGAGPGPVDRARPVRADVVAGDDRHLLLVERPRERPGVGRQRVELPLGPGRREHAVAARVAGEVEDDLVRARPDAPGQLGPLEDEDLRGISAARGTARRSEAGRRHGHRDLGPRLVLVLARRARLRRLARRQHRRDRDRLARARRGVRGGRDRRPTRGRSGRRRSR